MKRTEVFAELNQVGLGDVLDRSNWRCIATWTTCCWDWRCATARRRRAR